GRFIEVEFKDTGCGIKEEDQERVFDALFTTKAKGIGLGLAVTQGIIERHEGQIKLKSEVGKGTTFVIRLPIAKEEIGGKQDL
ncbi:MAG: ATP-binding protein, partial [Nitrospirota bacterium]|nr:ATP-binding protein [Nitrospirota bacterium]